jgi:hypothetical protein
MKILFLSILSLIILGCNKDDDNENKVDYTSFFEKTRPQFTGNINNNSLFWDFNVGTYQMSSASLYPNGDSTDPNRLLRFVLNEENGNNQFIITTPIFDISSENDFNTVFSLGKKKLGDYNENYHISITNNNYTYQICNSAANYNIEVLKTEEIILESPNQNILKVWFKIDNIELNKCNPNINYSLTNGLLLAQFIGYRND